MKFEDFTFQAVPKEWFVYPVEQSVNQTEKDRRSGQNSALSGTKSDGLDSEEFESPLLFAGMASFLHKSIVATRLVS
jgi:hypothetical protein